MQPEHEQFLFDHVKKFGFIFIIDKLKDQFHDLSHEKACDIYDEFKAKHANDAIVKQSDSQLKEFGKKVGDEIEKQLRKR